MTTCRCDCSARVMRNTLFQQTVSPTREKVEPDAYMRVFTSEGCIRCIIGKHCLATRASPLKSTISRPTKATRPSRPFTANIRLRCAATRGEFFPRWWMRVPHLPQTFVDTYSKWAAAKLYTTRTPITGTGLLNDRFLPSFSSMEMGIIRMLTDRAATTQKRTWGSISGRCPTYFMKLLDAADILCLVLVVEAFVLGYALLIVSRNTTSTGLPRP